jgi:hypothetical protein
LLGPLFWNFVASQQIQKFPPAALNFFLNLPMQPIKRFGSQPLREAPFPRSALLQEVFCCIDLLSDLLTNTTASSPLSALGPAQGAGAADANGGK